MRISERMKERRKELGLSADEVARYIGVSRSNVYRYEKGDIENLPLEILYPLSKVLRTTPQELMGWENEENTNIHTIYNKLEPPRQQKVYTFAEHQLEEQQKPEIKETVVPYISLLSAGTGIIDLDPTHENEEVYSGYVPKHDLAFKVSGDSMEPLFENGELVFVEKTSDIHNGQVIAVQINEEAYIKKAYIEEDKLRLVSLNKEYEDVYASKDDDIRIVGRVLL